MVHSKIIITFLTVFIMMPVCVKAQVIEDLWPEAAVQQSEYVVLDTLVAANKISTRQKQLVNPGLIRTNGGRVVLYDFYRRQLFAASLEDYANTVTPVGKGYGSGPGEYRFISSIDIDNQYNVFALDTELMRLSTWDEKYDISDMYKTEGGLPGKIATTNDGFVIKYSSVGGAEYLFETFTKEGDSQKRFHEFKQWQGTRSPLLYEGNIVGTRDAVIYSSSNFGVLKSYDILGNHRFTRKMINPLNGLQMQVNRSGNSISVSRDGASKFAAIDLDSNGDLIYVLFSGTEFLRSNRIDIYKLSDGAYAGSYLLDEQVLKFSVDDNYIYAIQQESENREPKIIVYNLPTLPF